MKRSGLHRRQYRRNQIVSPPHRHLVVISNEHKIGISGVLDSANIAPLHSAAKQRDLYPIQRQDRKSADTNVHTRDNTQVYAGIDACNQVKWGEADVPLFSKS